MTPLLEQYYRIKARYRDKILFFRVGDFYETFDEDAKLVSKELNIVLTRRSKDEPVPMAGIPYHALDAYLSRLVKKGYEVAICEQLEDPKKAKGLVKRDVVRIVTPGTLIEDSLLSDENNFLMGIYGKNNRFGFAILDISTGEFFAGEVDSHGILAEILRLSPSEILINNDAGLSIDARVKILTDDYFGDYETTLKNHFGVSTLEGFGLSELALKAAGATLKYAKENTMSELKNVNSLGGYFSENFLMLDSTTLKNLEVFRNVWGNEKYTLYSSINSTSTPMGARMLRRWMENPLLNLKEIERRLDAVEELIKKPMDRDRIKEKLKNIKDLERIESRISIGKGSPKDLINLRESLKSVMEISARFESSLLREVMQFEDVSSLVDLLNKSIAGDFPIGEGVIREGYDDLLDDYRNTINNAKKLIAEMEQRERRRTGIKTLKIGYNDVMGYYIEVGKSHIKKVPPHYKRKQTLKNSERYITDELKDLEYKILSAKEKIKELEEKIYRDIIEKVQGYGEKIKKIARKIAILDVLINLAEIAEQRDYTRPIVDESLDIIIREGRHPVVELYTDFVPNDTNMNAEARFIVLTGPNMAGKSTYMRQVALIVILAQMGSFVPASYAKIGLVDRIYTRVGASDDITRGRSTFMVEMIEVANILNTATERSLILLDEIGRGTSTYDGLAIAWSVTEYIHNEIRARTIFATHYHHLIDLENILPNLRNYHIAVKETTDGLVFVRKVMPGGMSKSYGIEVASLAGLPKSVVSRAKEVLNLIEKENAIEVRRKTGKVIQATLFGGCDYDDIIDEIRRIDIMNMTPLQALNKLNELKKRIDSK